MGKSADYLSNITDFMNEWEKCVPVYKVTQDRLKWGQI